MAAELTDTKIDQIIPGAKPIVMDGGNGLHLTSKRSLSGERICRSWSFQYYLGEVRISANGKRRSVRREMGLGPYPKIGVKEAYRLAAVAAGLVAQGIDPKADRDAKRAAHALDRARKSLSRSFRDVAREWLAKHEQEWSRRDYAIDVAQSLTTTFIQSKSAVGASVTCWSMKLTRRRYGPFWTPCGSSPMMAANLTSLTNFAVASRAS